MLFSILCTCCRTLPGDCLGLLLLLNGLLDAMHDSEPLDDDAGNTHTLCGLDVD